MKSIQFLLILVLCVVICSSCAEQYKTEDFVGTWILSQDDEIGTALYSTITFEYKADGSIVVGALYQNEMNFKSKWLESSENTFRISRNKLYEEWEDAMGRKYRTVKKIQTLDDLHFSVTVLENHSGYTDLSFRKPYTQSFRKVEKDESIMLGTWNILSPLDEYRLVFKEKHLFDLYVRENNEWVLRKNRPGSWYIYGDLLCVTSFGDIAQNNEVRAESAYGFYIKDGPMLYWKSSTSGKELDYVLQKVSDEY